MSRSRGRGWRGRRGRGRGRDGGPGYWREPENIPDLPPPPLIRPIFDWSEVSEHFPSAAPQLDFTFLTQLLTKKAQEISPSVEEQALVQGLCTIVTTVMENMILTGEGEEMMLDEVRPVGPQKMGTSLAGNKTSEVAVLLRDFPNAVLVSKLASKVAENLNAAHDDRKGQVDDDGPFSLRIVSSNAFKINNSKGATTIIYVTTTGDKVYGMLPKGKEPEDMVPYKDALRMIRHAKWWEDHTSHLKSVRSLARILKDMRGHVPGLQSLSDWYIQLLCNCAVIPLLGDEPLSLVDSFRRAWELISAGLFLPGSIGIPDPCEDKDHGIHENLSHQACDELTRNGQMILQMLYFGAYREVMAMDGAAPLKFTQSYSFGGVTLGVAAPACDKPTPETSSSEQSQTA